MALFMPIGSGLSFMLVELKVKESVIFYVAAVLTLINMVVLFFFDEKEYKREGSPLLDGGQVLK